MNPLLAGAQWVIGGIAWAVIAWGAWVTVRHWRNHLAGLAHPEPVCLARHQHQGRRLADYLRKNLPDVPDTCLASMCEAFAAALASKTRQHGPHVAAVLLCDLDGAVRELRAAERELEVPR